MTLIGVDRLISRLNSFFLYFILINIQCHIQLVNDPMESLTEVIEHHPDLTMSDTVPLEQRYKASMVLSGAGDALGCNHGTWEFENDGVLIHEQVQKRGGLEKLDAIDFPVSDDTVMHLATAEALVKVGEGEGASLPVLYRALVEKYIVSMTDMAGRGAGM